MQSKNLIAGGLSGILIFAGLFYALLETGFPASVAQLLLNFAGHEVRELSMEVISFRHRQIHVGELRLEDENKSIYLENLFVDLDGAGIKTVSADAIQFRDRTKPNSSLRELLRRLLAENSHGDPVCVGEIRVEHMEAALSFAGAPLIISNVLARDLCVGSPISFTKLNFISPDLDISNGVLFWRVHHKQFYDVETEARLEFPISSRALQAQPRNANELMTKLVN